jgi:CDP-glycerol glycerophosphotransferase (TagB/SpsB family)
LSERYGYTPEQVKLIGLPRFDALESKSERVILFMPTWRKELSLPDKRYSPSFKASPFFRSLNDFRTSSGLRAVLTRYGFTVQFKLHPEMAQQREDFAASGNICITDASYQKLFECGALLITDYSSVAFDFAYLKKPVLYYQAAEPHHEPSYFDYEAMGFGAVVRTADELVGAVEKLLQTGCQMDGRYQKRVDDFFAFHDRNNCKRVYDAILQIGGVVA